MLFMSSNNKLQLHIISCTAHKTTELHYNDDTARLCLPRNHST